MSRGLVATASTTIDANKAAVWRALTTPASIKEYMFGSTVASAFKVGSPITWSGEWKGKPYQDKGEILRSEPEKVLSYSHFSPLTGAPDVPENYHTVTIELSSDGPRTVVSLSQDNNATETERDHSANNWVTMLAGLKKVVESVR